MRFSLRRGAIFQHFATSRVEAYLASILGRLGPRFGGHVGAKTASKTLPHVSKKRNGKPSEKRDAKTPQHEPVLAYEREAR